MIDDSTKIKQSSQYNIEGDPVEANRIPLIKHHKQRKLELLSYFLIKQCKIDPIGNNGDLISKS